MRSLTPPTQCLLLLIAGFSACDGSAGVGQPSVVASKSGEDPDGDTRLIYWEFAGTILQYSAVSESAADSTVMLKLEVDKAGVWKDLVSDFQARGPVADGSQDLYEHNVSRTPSGTLLRLTATFYDSAGNITDNESSLLAVP